MFAKIMSPMTAENLAASVNAIVDLTGAPLDNKHMLTRSGGDDTEARLLAGKLATFRYRLLELVGGRKLSPGTNAAHLAFNAQPIQLNNAATPTHTICGITNAVAIPAPMASVPSEEAIPPVKYVIR